MIDIEELKPILSEILTDENSVDIIEKIQAIDKPGVTQADLDKLDNEWKERYRKAFLTALKSRSRQMQTLMTLLTILKKRK